jgi:DNA-binding transcriptional ArsR family regulator
MFGEKNSIKAMNYEERENEVRSPSDKNWYWVSRAILKRYGRILKSSGLAIYNVLASYANSKSQTCFPTQKSIAGHLGLSIRTVNRKIRLLKDFKLIKVRKNRGRSFYSLLRADTPKETPLYDKRDIGDTTPGKSNNNKYIKIINKNNGTNGFNNLKPLSQLIKRYEPKTPKNHRH